MKVSARKLRADLVNRSVEGKLILNLVGLRRSAQTAKQRRHILFAEGYRQIGLLGLGE